MLVRRYVSAAAFEFFRADAADDTARRNRVLVNALARAASLYMTCSHTEKVDGLRLNARRCKVPDASLYVAYFALCGLILSLGILNKAMTKLERAK